MRLTAEVNWLCDHLRLGEIAGALWAAGRQMLAQLGPFGRLESVGGVEKESDLCAVGNPT